MTNTPDREAKIAEIHAIFKEATEPPVHELLSVFPLDAGNSYFDASPAQVASRVSSLTMAANLVMTGDSLCDKMLTQSICVDLLDTAAWLARKLAHYHDDLDQATWKLGS